MSSSPREENRVPGLIAKSDADNTPVILEADPVTKRLKTTTTVSGIISDEILQNMVDELSSLVNNLKFLATMQGTDASLRTNITQGTVTTVTTVSTVSSVTAVANQTNSGGFALTHDVMSSINTNAAVLRQQIITT